MSPTQRTLKLLRDAGWTAAVVERWNQYAKVRNDLFGFCDVLAMRPGAGFLAVQATSGSNLSKRIEKLKAEPCVGLWLASGGRVEAHGWSKKGPRGRRKRWQVRRMVCNNGEFHDVSHLTGINYANNGA